MTNWMTIFLAQCEFLKNMDLNIGRDGKQNAKNKMYQIFLNVDFKIKYEDELGN